MHKKVRTSSFASDRMHIYFTSQANKYLVYKQFKHCCTVMNIFITALFSLKLSLKLKLVLLRIAKKKRLKIITNFLYHGLAIQMTKLTFIWTHWAFICSFHIVK